ncbi:MAG: choice-of-anchor D domain-containing protein [Bryobacteraceae bacterium]
MPAVAAGPTASICDAVPGNLVLNCGFETGDFAQWLTTLAAIGSDFDVIEYYPYSGTYAARFGALNGKNDYIDQSFATTPGHSYTVTFYLDASRENIGGEFVANWNGTNLLTIPGSFGTGYQFYTFTAQATSGSTDLQFGGNSLRAFYYLDDVVVTDTDALGPAENLRVWGDNAYGELGNGVNVNSNLPVQVGTLADVVAMAGGFYHSLALKSTGTVWSWGDNQSGELGNGSNTNNNVPAQVGGLAGIVAIAGGGSHSLALKSDGTVWAWGSNQSGELGNGNNTNSNVPVQVTGLTGVVAIAGGGYPYGFGTSLALKSDGTVWAWGDNQYGELGNGSNANSNVPVQVSGLTGVVAIAGGSYHSLALKSDGMVWVWGDNQYGELGNGSNTDSNVPVQVNGLTGVVAIAGGLYHSLALKSGGTVWSWGYNVDGELGSGSNANSNVPVQVSGLAGVAAIASGGDTSLALKSDATVWSWGSNLEGELGNGSNVNSNAPVQVNGFSGVVAIAVGFYHVLAALGGSLPILTVQPASLSFAANGQQTITLTNGGTAPLTIGKITILGVTAGDFSTSGTCSGASLAPTASCTVTVTLAATASGARSAALMLVANAPGSPLLLPLSGTGAVQSGSGAPSVTTVVSASEFGGFSSVAPGSWVEIYGSNLAPDTREWAGTDFQGNNAPTTLDGVTVTIGNQKAFIAYIAANPGQINAQLPSNIATGDQQLTVTNGTASSAPFSITVNATQPGLLAPASFKLGANQYVVALLPDGTYVLPTGSLAGVNSRPAKPGETITLYGIGFGPVTPNFPAGQIVTQQNQLELPLTISFGQTAAELSYYGLAPTLVGLYQFNVIVPAVPDNDQVPLTFNLGGVAGPQTLFTSVHQ